MRLTVTIEEYSLIKLGLQAYKTKNIDDCEDIDCLYNKIEQQFKQSLVVKSIKRNATKKATYVRMDRSKEKIRNIINLMNLENQKITVNSIAKRSGVSYNTVKKYNYLLQFDTTE
jgi:hypothetical protein